MLFNSLHFLVFFPVVFIAYYLLPGRYRTYLLLAASCYFYMAFVPEYILILFALIGIDFFMAQKIAKAENSKKKHFLLISIISSLGILFLFKYFNFFNENVEVLAHFLGFNYTPFLLSIALPLGLSFHVFQSLSYVIEVYKGKYVPEKNFYTYSLYVLFFPQLVAGPIERPGNLLPQLHLEHRWNGLEVRRGLEQMLWGFFKKLVIADQIAQIIDPMYRNVPTESSLLFVVAVLFTFQLYADFSGYSDIAIGAAKMLGFQLQINFNRPFVATSLSDFWRRWHISLSNWLRDYLYYPLALSTGKKSTYKLYFALFVTFVLIGLWHGANWTFVFFGMFHGTYLVVELLTDPVRKKIRSALGFSSQVIWYRFIQQSVVFFAATCSFIIFRSETLSSAKRFIEQLFTMPSFLFIRYELFSTLAVSVGSVIVIAVGISILSMLFVEYIQEKKKTFFIVEDKPAWIRYTWYYGLTLAILFFGYFGSETFIYFKF